MTESLKSLKETPCLINTAIAILEGLDIPSKLREYSIATKSGMMDVETAEKVAEEPDIPLIASGPVSKEKSVLLQQAWTL